MSTETIAQGAINLIEELLDERTYGKVNISGNYVFPLCRAARIRMLEQDYDFVFPIDLPEEYMKRYEIFLQKAKE